MSHLRLECVPLHLLGKGSPPSPSAHKFKPAYLVQVLGLRHQEEAQRGEEQDGQDGQLCRCGKDGVCICERNVYRVSRGGTRGRGTHHSLQKTPQTKFPQALTYPSKQRAPSQLHGAVVCVRALCLYAVGVGGWVRRMMRLCVC